MRSLTASLIKSLTVLAAVILIFLNAHDSAWANGATRTLVKEERAGPYLLQIGILPGKPRIGNLHLSIRVWDAETEDPILVSVVMVAARGPEGATDVRPVRAVNFPDSPQFYDVDISLDQLGGWALTLDVDGELGEATIEVPLEVTEAGGISVALVAAGFIALLAASIWIWGFISKRRRRRRKT